MKPLVTGGLPRLDDGRDINLGTVQALTVKPAAYKTDVSWLEPIWQSNTPACGPHSGIHLKQILDYSDTGVQKYSPEELWLEIKQIDNHLPEEGTDMRSILKALLNRGACDYGLLPNIFPTTVAEYSDQRKLTKEMRDNAQPRIIKAYGFDTPARAQNAIYANKAVILLIDIGNTWFNQEQVIPFTRKDSGHFVVGYGYSADGSIDIIDSVDKNKPFKTLSPDYPIREVGTAVDLPDWQVKAMTTQIKALNEKVAQLLALINKKK